MRAVFGRGVKKRNGRRLAGNPADFVNTLASEFWVFTYGMVKIRFIPPRPNSVLYAFFRPSQSMLNFFVSGGLSTPITLFYALDGHRMTYLRDQKLIFHLLSFLSPKDHFRFLEIDTVPRITWPLVFWCLLTLYKSDSPCYLMIGLVKSV